MFRKQVSELPRGQAGLIRNVANPRGCGVGDQFDQARICRRRARSEHVEHGFEPLGRVSCACCVHKLFGPRNNFAKVEVLVRDFADRAIEEGA